MARGIASHPVPASRFGGIRSQRPPSLLRQRSHRRIPSSLEIRCNARFVHLLRQLDGVFSLRCDGGPGTPTQATLWSLRRAVSPRTGGLPSASGRTHLRMRAVATCSSQHCFGGATKCGPLRRWHRLSGRRGGCAMAVLRHRLSTLVTWRFVACRGLELHPVGRFFVRMLSSPMLRCRSR
jgi:hypothetical protein